MKPDGWCCTICGKFDLREHPEQLAKPEHVLYRGRGVDIGECPGKFMPFVWLSRMTDDEEGEQAPTRDSSEGERPVIGDDIGGPAAPDAETKPQQSPASDGGLDEIVRDACEELGVEKTWPTWDAHLNVIAAACIRARETDPPVDRLRDQIDGALLMLMCLRDCGVIVQTPAGPKEASAVVRTVESALGKALAILDGKGAGDR